MLPGETALGFYPNGAKHIDRFVFSNQHIGIKVSERINIMALQKEQLVTLLKKTGSKNCSLEMLDSDIAAGMPLNANGTINLIHYAAWLLQRNSTP